MLRLASFNALNLNSIDHYFVGRDDSRPYDDSKYAEKINFLSARLEEISADIVGFQEIFSEAALKDAVSSSAFMRGAQVCAPLAQSNKVEGKGMVADGPHVGIASKLPIVGKPQMISDFPEDTHLLVPTGLHGSAGEIHQLSIRKFERPVLRAEIKVDGLPGLTVFVAHLKSKRPKVLAGEFSKDPIVSALGSVRSLIVRAAEAAALRSLIVAARNEWVDGKRRPVIVLGDVNDDIDSVTTQMLVGRRPFGRDGSIDRRDYHFRTIDLMLSAFELAPLETDAPYTHVFDGTGSIIDMILLSADFFGVAGEQRAKVVKSEIFNDFLKYKPTDVTKLPRPERYKDKEDRDWLEDNEPTQRLRNPKTDLDHGIPVAEISLI